MWDGEIFWSRVKRIVAEEFFCLLGGRIFWWKFLCLLLGRDIFGWTDFLLVGWREFLVGRFVLVGWRDLSLALPTKAKDNVFRFIVEYSTFMDF